jgi:hypothetical protein
MPDNFCTQTDWIARGVDNNVASHNEELTLVDVFITGASNVDHYALRAILIRFAVPTIVAVSILAYIGVPYADRMLSDWFRADVQMRAQLVANSMSTLLVRLVERNDTQGLSKYLSSFTADERLLAIVLCRANDSLIYKTDRTPASISCAEVHAVEDAGSQLMQLPTGSAEASAFSYTAANDVKFRALIVQDLSFIDRRQSTAHRYVLALAGVIGSLLALLVGFTFWLLVQRWIKLLIGDIRGFRFLDDAQSESSSWPILKQVRKALSEIETTQRLEIDFHENWTPQALQQVVREHLRSPEIFVVSNREPYIHNTGPSGPVAQLPASGMVTALEPIVRACSGTWVAHGSGSADREVVDRNDRIRVPPEDPSYTPRRVWLSSEEEEGFYYGFSNEGLC